MIVLGNSTVTTVNAGNAASTLVVAANAARDHLTIQNMSDTVVYLSEGTPAENVKGFVLLSAGANIYVTGENGVVFKGAIYSFVTGASKALMVKEN